MQEESESNRSEKLGVQNQPIVSFGRRRRCVRHVSSWSFASMLHIYQFSSVNHNNVICAQQPQEGAGDPRMEFVPLPKVSLASLQVNKPEILFFLGLKLTWKVTDFITVL